MGEHFDGCGLMFWYALFIIGGFLLYFTSSGQALLFQIR